MTPEQRIQKLNMELAEERAHADQLLKSGDEILCKARKLEQENVALRAALTEILEIADYRKTVAWMRKNNFKLDGDIINNLADKFTFILYSNLGEITNKCALALCPDADTAVGALVALAAPPQEPAK